MSTIRPADLVGFTLVGLVAIALTQLTGCRTSQPGSAPSPQTHGPVRATHAATPAVVSEAETAARLDRVLAGDQRTVAERALDPDRHPKQTLLFFGIRPGMRVLEAWPGSGWYAEIIAPLLKGNGEYYAALQPEDPGSRYISGQRQALRQKLAARPDLYGGAELTTLGRAAADIAPPGSIDLVVTFCNVHNWMAQGWAPAAIEAMYRALKPGGVLGVVDHRGPPDHPQDLRAKNGYVNEDYAVRLIEAGGFELVARSQINANAKDTKDYPQGVWTLPPTYRLGDRNRDVYAAIGASDRFTLKFVKPSASRN